GALIEAVRSALSELGAGADVEVVVERSARPEFGDWSTPAPLRAARVLRRAPMQIAEELRAGLEAAAIPLVAEWTVSPPGYVNARLRDEAWAPLVISRALDIDPSRDLELPPGFPPAPGKVLVEHTATNPNKAA